MKRLLAPLVGVLATIGLTVVSAPPAAAGSVPLTGLGWSATLAFPDMQWADFIACQNGKATVVLEGSEWVRGWEFNGEIRSQAGGHFAGRVHSTGNGTGTFSDNNAVRLCPDAVPKTTTYVVTGEFAVNVAPSWVSAWVYLPFTTTFAVTAMPTTTTLAAPTQSGTQTTFSGQVQALSPKGAIPADRSGQVAIEILTGSAWSRLGVGALDGSGNYAIPAPVVLQAGTHFRARYLGTDTCAASSSAPQVTPTPALPTPTVSLRAVSHKSKIKVDVNPNMGKKYWTFQVQKKNRDGSWKPLSTYRTKGTKETRTVNLRKGVYRVFVNPKFGYQGVMSANEVTLKK